MWAQALETRALRDAVAGAGSFAVRTLRMYGMPESEIAETLRVAEATGIDLAPLEITTCLRRGEIEVVTRYGPDGGTAYAALEDLVRERHAGTLFSDDGSTVDDLVARALLDQGATIATAESCTGGLLAARLTERAGSSSYVLGGIVAYANSAKVHVAGVDPELIARHGAVSLEVAEALAFGALRRLDADVGVGITGVAGPGGGTEAKPVGFVCLSAASADGRRITRSRAAARWARRRPRPLDHGGHAPRPQAPARRGRAGADRRLRRAALRGRRHPGRGARAPRLLGRGLCRRRARAAGDPGGAAASHARVPRVARRRRGAGDRRARHGVCGRPGRGRAGRAAVAVAAAPARADGGRGRPVRAPRGAAGAGVRGPRGRRRTRGGTAARGARTSRWRAYAGARASAPAMSRCLGCRAPPSRWRRSRCIARTPVRRRATKRSHGLAWSSAPPGAVTSLVARAARTGKRALCEDAPPGWFVR